MKRLVIFNGSPRKNGTSYSFSHTIKKLAEDSGNAAEIVHIIDYFDGKKDIDSLIHIISKSDILGLVTPLYVDTLPYPVIWFLEKLSCDLRTELNGKDFFAVSQCGLPDVTLFKPLLGSCRIFAESVSMNWLGGLGYGGGAIINGELMENLGSKGRKITSGFKIALEDILNEKMISSRAQDLLTIRIPKILLWPISAFLNYKSKSMARKSGVKDLSSKVYLE